jgi:hypothetical protein
LLLRLRRVRQGIAGILRISAATQGQGKNGRKSQGLPTAEEASLRVSHKTN